MSKLRVVIISVAVVLVGILYRYDLEIAFKNIYKKFTDNFDARVVTEGVFTIEQLAQYNGSIKKKLYVAVLGTVFDVTKGKNHYGKDAPYNYFTGKDGSRALVTGNFTDESEDKDHVLDLPCKDIFQLLNWLETFKGKYNNVGVLKGRYFDGSGKPSSYSEDLNDKIEHCHLEKELTKKKERTYPPCNIEWTAHQGSKVWCTKNSGGVRRSWVGVPRQMYNPGEEKPHCVCVNPEMIDLTAVLKEYPNCSSTSTTCFIETS